MIRVLKYTVQTVLYIAFAALVGYLSVYPTYHYASADKAQVKLSLSHAANRVMPCVKLTSEQIADLAANMRVGEKCERERLPLVVELEVDGELMFHIVARPSGFWSDGPASIYERFDINSGEHNVTARLRDTNRAEGWDYVHTETVTLEPGRYFTVRFRPETGGFSFR